MINNVAVIVYFQILGRCRTLPQLQRIVQNQGLDPNDTAVQLRRVDLQVSSVRVHSVTTYAAVSV